jgi:hypothetical protein
MWDFLGIAGTVVMFAVGVIYVAGCERLKRSRTDV